MKTLTITLPADIMMRLAGLLAEAGANAMDDGREGDPDGKLLYQVAELARKSAVTK